MGCGSCATTTGAAPKGCKSNGHCATGGCNKLNVYDWLSDVEIPTGYKPLNIAEVRFKGSRKEFYRINTPDLYTGDVVIVQAENGFDVGHISLSGELVRLQLKKYNIDAENPEMLQVVRKAGDKEVERYQQLKDKEAEILETARTLALELKLQMKLSDIEIRGDGKKVTFFYTAEERVDFRELIKKYAELFKMRIEMRQIGYRQEAARLGGIGSCGRELCCSTWLTDFKVVNISAARYQNLSINMLKLSGQCGRLKCCLNYELDTYVETLSSFPKGEDAIIRTKSGSAKPQKTDILKKIMWYAYEGSSEWFALDLSRVQDILAKNKAGEIPDDVKVATEVSGGIQKYMQEDVIAESDLTRLDKDDEEELRNERQRRNRNNKKGGNWQNNKPQNNTNRQDNRNQQNNRREQQGRNDNRNNPQNKRNEPRNDNRNNPQNRPGQDGNRGNRPPQNKRPHNPNRNNDNRNNDNKKDS